MDGLKIPLHCYVFNSLLSAKIFTADGTDGADEETFVFIRVIREIRG